MSGEGQVRALCHHTAGGWSARGAQHQRRELPNQDAFHCWQPTAGRLPLVVAVADGHGSASHFRSDQGARFAVQVAARVGEQIASRSQDLDFSTVKREAEERLPQEISRLWSESVAAHLTAHPFTEHELERVAAAAGGGARERCERDGQFAYGSTLLFAIVVPRFIFFGQLGDGDLLWVEPSADTSMLFPPGSDEVGEETASLCMRDAARHFQVKVLRHQDSAPPLILAATDGYRKSFVNDAEFLKIGGDYLAVVRQQGVEGLSGALPGFLADASANGSGDDVTLAFVRTAEEGDFDSRRSQQAEIDERIAAKADREEVEHLQAAVKAMEDRARDRDAAWGHEAEDVRGKLSRHKASCHLALLVTWLSVLTVVVALGTAAWIWFRGWQ